MAFVCYSLVVAALGLAYEEPDLFAAVALLLAAWRVLRGR